MAVTSARERQLKRSKQPSCSFLRVVWLDGGAVRGWTVDEYCLLSCEVLEGTVATPISRQEFIRLRKEQKANRS